MNVLLLALALAQLPGEPIPRIVGETKVPAFGLVRLTADAVPAKSALRWRVTPSKGVERATTARERLEFTAPPGEYAIELLIIWNTPDGVPVLHEIFATVAIAPPPGWVPPGGGGPTPDGTPDPVKALGKLRIGNGLCTATVIGPRRADGRWNVFTAAHCTGEVGTAGRFILKDGRDLGVRIKVRSTEADLVWMVTEDSNLASLPYALLAEKEPTAGEAVWQAGYGWDRPLVRKNGTVLGGPDSNGQNQYDLSVSNGDSGGPIVLTKTGQVVGAVCCTTRIAQKGRMWAGGVTTARMMLARVQSEEAEYGPSKFHPIQRVAMNQGFPLGVPWF